MITNRPSACPRIVSLLLVFFLSLATHHAHTAACDPIRALDDGKSPQREIFVSPGGNNSTGNGSRSAPYQTISRALQGIRAGDAVRLLPGTYAGGASFNGLTGSSNAPIWIGGVRGEDRPVISGGSFAFQLSRARHVVLENLVVTRSTANGINCDDGGDYANPNASGFLLFRNLAFRDIGSGGNQDGLKLSGIYDYQVLDCEFTRTSAGGSGIDHVGCHRGLIARCSFSDIGANGNAVQCKGGSEDIEIRASQFSNAGGRAINIGGSTGFEFFRPPLTSATPNFEAKNIRVLACQFRGSDAPLAFVGAVNCVAANNTIIEPVRWVIRILQETVSSGGYTFLPSGSNQFFNNLVYYNRTQVGTHVNVGGNTSPASFQFANNLWFAFNAPAQSRPTLPSVEANGLYGLNPLLRDAANGDYSVPTNSPASAKGRALARPKADLRENCYANPPTIGAFEALPPPPQPADSDGDQIPNAWETANGLNPLDPADAALDPDADRLNNLGEYLAGTDPRDARSVFALEVARLAGDAFTFRFSTVTGRVYRVHARDFSTQGWSEVARTNGTGAVVEFHHPAPLAGAKLFRVQLD